MFKNSTQRMRELVYVDSHTGKVSHKKFWSNVGYAIIAYSYLTFAHGDNWFMNTLVVGLILVGNKTIKDIMAKTERVKSAATD